MQRVRRNGGEIPASGGSQAWLRHPFCAPNRVTVRAIAFMGELKGSLERGGRMRFPRAARLLRHADFERVYKKGRRHFSASMTVFYLQRAQLQDGGKSPVAPGMRVGFTVGRALGGAVQRNRMKRRLREAVRQRRQACSVPVDVVINPKKSLLTTEFSQLLEEVGRAFQVIQQKLTEKPRGQG